MIIADVRRQIRKVSFAAFVLSSLVTAGGCQVEELENSEIAKVGKKACKAAQSAKFNITGGHQVDDREKYSWMGRVYFMREAILSCGATLIGPKWALTAAHCVQNRDVYFFTYDTLDLSDNSSRVDVKRVVVHPQYAASQPKSFPKKEYDLALIELEHPIANRAINLPYQNPSEGQAVQAAGWGLTHVDGDASELLKEIELNVYSDSDCDRYQDGFCVRKKDLSSGGVCGGDSGGPAFTSLGNGQYELLGIASRGNCNNYSIFVKLYDYLPWIESVTGLKKPATVPQNKEKNQLVSSSSTQESNDCH